MLTLAFESSAKAASVALVEDGRLIAQYSQVSGLTHSRTLLPMAEDLLKNTEKDLSQIDLLAVAHGPGSFTGIRIGVSTVKGLAWAGDKKCVGVSTLEALAWNAAGMSGFVCPVMDARRSQVYTALFEVVEGVPVRQWDDEPISLEELAERLSCLGCPVLLVGDGAELAYNYLSEKAIPCRLAADHIRWQSAWGVAMAARDKEPGDAHSLLPVYLRLSQAERERQERLNMR